MKKIQSIEQVPLEYAEEQGTGVKYASIPTLAMASASWETRPAMILVQSPACLFQRQPMQVVR
jgi:hypothetical protein